MANIINKTAGQEKTRKEIEAISEKMKASKLGINDIIIPLSAAIVLIILALFVFVPMIKAATGFRTEYKEIREKEEKLEKLESELRKMDEGTFQIDIINAKEVIPKTLRVSSFMYYIDTLANEKRLTSRSLSAGDIQVTVTKTEESEKTKKSYLGVSGPLSYNGSLENILDFLDSLYSASPYIISLDNVSLKKSESDWKVTLNVTGYYVPEGQVTVDPYLPFTSYTRYQDVVDIFGQKAEKLK
jgi:Tfp pilus assembly protein PilO